jgi:hypothetical protein
MGLKCRIGRRADGTLLVTNENGTPSSLYQQALAYTKNEKDALEMWAVASTPDFVESIGKKGTVDDVSLESVIQYYNSNKKLIGTLTPSETFEVKQMMADHNVGRLSEMAAKLKDIFYEGNVPNFYPERAIKSGLFTSEDVKNIDLARIGDLIMRMEADALVNDFSIETSTTSSGYRNPSVRNIFGASEVVPMEAVYQEVIAAVENPQSEQEIRQAVQDLPYTDLVTKFNEDEAFAEQFISKFKNIRKIPVIEERDGELVADVTNTFSTIKNTISTDIDQLDIEAEILYIEGIPANIWEESRDDIVEVIKEIEEDFADKNIDIVGLSEVTTDQATILRVLNAVNEMVKEPTNQNIQVFSDIYDSVFGKVSTKSVEKLPKELDGLTIVRMNSEKSDQQLFEQHGLIKVGDGLYHKVRTTDSLTDLYEAVYQQVKNGLVEIPERFNLTKDVNQKENTLKDIEKFINSRKTGLDFYNERASLYQVIFGHPTMDNSRKVIEDVKALAGVVKNVDYLKAGFISDFYNYILKEKLKNSAVYRNTLSKIGINNRDITIGNDISDLKNIEYYEELMDYLALKKDSTGKKYIAKEFKQEATNVLTAINFPQSVGEYNGVKNIVGNLMSIPRTVNNFVRIGDTLYQKVGENQQTSVFVKVRPNTDNLYYQTEVETEEYTKEQVEKMKKQDMAALTQLTPEDIQQRNEKNGSLSKFVKAVKAKSIEYAKKVQANFQASTQKTESKSDIKFEQNLIEFIKQKGINVIADSKVFADKIKETGFDSLNAMAESSNTNFLQTPQGDILGFEKNGSIYLDPEKINNTTTLHELIHVFQSITEIKANQGDTRAQDIISKRQELFQDEATFWKEYHKNNVSPTTGINPLVVGEQGALNLDTVENVTFRLSNLTVAKEMESANKDAKTIRLATGWEKGADGLWRYEILDGKLKSDFSKKIQSIKEENKENYDFEGRLEDVLDNEELFNAFPKLRSVNVQMQLNIDNEGEYEPEGLYFPEGGSFPNGNIYIEADKGDILLTLLHEVQHTIQQEEGFAKGGNMYGNFEKLSKEEQQKVVDNYNKFVDKRKSIKVFAKENRSKVNVDNADEDILFREWLYNALVGEVEARNVQERRFMSPERRREILLEQTEDVAREDQVTIFDTLQANEQKNTVPLFQAIGEKGAANLDAIEEATYRMDNLKVAREMESKKKSAKKIKQATGWERGADSKWRYEILDERTTKFFREAFNKNYRKKYDDFFVKDFLSPDSELLKAYPELKDYKTRVDFKDFPEQAGAFNPESNTITLYARSQKIKMQDFQKIFIHELQHAIQFLEGFSKSRNVYTLTYSEIKKELDKRYENGSISKSFYEKRLSDLEDVKIFGENALSSFKKSYYKRLSGETESRNMEERMNMTLQQRRDTLLQETEDVAREDQIFLFQTMTTSPAGTALSELGLDLSSKVYAQAPGESDVEYNSRMLREVEAFITAPQIAEKLENLRKENPSLWQQIVDFITNLTNYLKNQIGLSDYQGDILSMTKEQYIDALGVSVLKDDYSMPIQPSLQKMKNDIMLQQMALDSRIEILILPSEQEEQELLDKMDNCGL